LAALAQPPPGRSAVTHLLRLEGEVAVVEVVLLATQEQPALRQTRVYRQFEREWMRVPPSAAHWGDEASRYESWDTLIPAVFEVSADEVQAGWQSYLAEHYAIKPPPTD
jgi:hypothetical protein